VKLSSGEGPLPISIVRLRWDDRQPTLVISGILRNDRKKVEIAARFPPYVESVITFGWSGR
jgi:hypothetical protein